MLHVFVSYSRRNTALVSPLIAYLQEQGIDVWIDRENFPPGTPEFDEAIREGVQRADYVLYMGTPEARKSTAVNGELQIVEHYQKPILPIWLSGEDWNDAAPLAYNSARYLDARGSTLESFGRQLIRVLDQQSRVSAPAIPAYADDAPLPEDASPRTSTGSSRRNVIVAAIISVVVILLTVYVLLRLVASNGSTAPSAAQRAAESTVQSFYSDIAKSTPEGYSAAYKDLAKQQQAQLTEYSFTLFAKQSDAQNGKVTAFHEIRYDRDTNNAQQATIQEQVTRAHGVTYTVGIQVVQEADGSCTLSALRAMTVHIGNNGFAIPTNDIQFTTLVTPEAIHTTPDGARATISNLLKDEMEMPLITLADLLDHPEIPTVGTTAIIVTVQHERYAVVVDQIGEESDMVVRKVPQQMRQRGVRGATITRTGEVLLILSLPAIIESAVETGRFGKRTPAIAQPPPEQPQGDYILVVDDSLSIRRGLEHSLKQAGYAVMLARDGVEAIEQMTRARPRLVILDIEMPQLNGYEVLEVLRTHEPFRDVRAIVLTSRAAQRYRQQAEALGAVGFLAKPCPTETLLEAIKQALIV